MKIRSITFALITTSLLAAVSFGAFAATAQEKAACLRQHGNLMGKPGVATVNIEGCWRAHGQTMTK